MNIPAWYESSSVVSLVRAARLSEAELVRVEGAINDGRVNNAGGLRAFLQTLSRERVAARTARLSPLPASELADVARLAGELARAERAAQVAERDDAIRSGALIVTAKPVEEIPAEEPAPEVIPASEPDPDRTLDLPSEVVVPSRPDIIVPARPTYPALPGKGGDAKTDKLTRASAVLAQAQVKAAHLGASDKAIPSEAVEVFPGLGYATVKSQSGQGHYHVTCHQRGPVVRPVSCDCAHFRARLAPQLAQGKTGLRCKHMEAVACVVAPTYNPDNFRDLWPEPLLHALAA